MISTNEKSNTVSFTTSEVFNSDNLSNQPPIEGRSSAALAIANDHASSLMDSETPPSSLPSNSTAEPSSKPTGAKSKKKNQSQKTQKPQSSIQQFLAPTTTSKQGIGQRVRDGLEQVLNTKLPHTHISPPPGITPLSSITEEDDAIMDTSETHKRSRTPLNSNEDDPNPP